MEISLSPTEEKLEQERQSTLYISPEGEICSDWWTPEVDHILESLGVPEDDPNRCPWCG